MALRFKVYQCATCKRSGQLERNDHGIENFGACAFTEKCPGPMHPTSRYTPSDLVFTRPFRPALFISEQPIKRKRWDVEHNLRTHPQVVVFQQNDDATTTEVDKTSYTVSYGSIERLTITFQTAISGSVHCLTVAGAEPVTLVPVPEITTWQLDNNALLTVGVLSVAPVNAIVTVYDPSTLVVTSVTTVVLSSDAPPYLSAWSGCARVVVDNKIYNVRTANVSDILRTATNGSLATIMLPVGAIVLLTTAPHSREDASLTHVVRAEAVATFGQILDTISIIDQHLIRHSATPVPALVKKLKT